MFPTQGRHARPYFHPLESGKSRSPRERFLDPRELSLDVGLTIGLGGRPGNVFTPDDARQRAVVPERPYLVPIGGAGHDEIAPLARHHLAPVDRHAESPGSPLVRGDDHLSVRMRAKRGVQRTIGIPYVDHRRVGALGIVDGQDRAVGSRGDRAGTQPRLGHAAPEDEGATVVALRIEDGDAEPRRVPGENGVAGPRGDVLQAQEFAGSLAPSTPRHQVISRRVEHSHFAGTTVGNHDAPIGQSGCVEDLVQHVRLFAFQFADRQRRLRSDPPWKARPLGWAGVLRDPDAGAVADETRQGERSLLLLLVLLAG